MWRTIKCSLVNLWCYRAPKPIDPYRLVRDLEWFRPSGFDEESQKRDRKEIIKRFLNIEIAGVGLRIAESSREEIPRHVYLTALQRSVKQVVEDAGYRAGLREQI